MIPNPSATRSELKQRFVFFISIVGVVFLILASRLFYLQIIKGIVYSNLSENNRIRAERLTPPRGMILDRHGRILADTVAAFDAVVVPSELPEEGREDIYVMVSTLLSLDPEEVKRVSEEAGPARWKPRLIKRQLTRKEMAMVEGRRLELTGFEIVPNPVRHYPYEKLLAGTLGYMGGIGKKELSSPEYEDYDGSDYIGRAGLEREWEPLLRGEPGGLHTEVDVLGRKLKEIARKPPVPGENIYLSIDIELQRIAEEALGDNVGSVVAMDINTGELLALVTEPTFDPNGLARGLSGDEWAALVNDTHHPLQNRPIQGLYAPGSTFKVVMALAGLAEGVITQSTTFNCTGALPFGGRNFRCWKHTGHGDVNLKEALESSCDVYFYELGLLLGVDTIHDYAALFGLGAPTGLTIPGESGGLVPSKSWKRRARGEPWYPGETLSVSIGQGYLLTTPLQLAVMTAALANPRSLVMEPRLLLKAEDASGEVTRTFAPRPASELPFRETHLGMVREGMLKVVYGEHGTGKNAQVEGLKVAGKTGTAQVVSMAEDESGIDPEEIAWRHRDHALFICYAPVEDPQIAVSVVVDHGGHGGSGAAPIAQKVLAGYKKLFMEGEGDI
ncbi:MAG: penicillin-binding protein 2 [Deltaproteobacteria bacterium]|nr:MAG: penicillin-binding protein 2 [Deltaproteobacteria bacterium]